MITISKIKEAIDGKDMYAKDEKENTIFHVFFERLSRGGMKSPKDVINELEVCKYCFGILNIDINTKGAMGDTLFHVLMENPRTNKNLDLIKYCVEVGGDINSRDMYDLTPFHNIAGGYVNLETLKYCIEIGGNLFAIENQSNWTVFDYLCNKFMDEDLLRYCVQELKCDLKIHKQAFANICNYSIHEINMLKYCVEELKLNIHEPYIDSGDTYFNCLCFNNTLDDDSLFLYCLQLPDININQQDGFGDTIIRNMLSWGRNPYKSFVYAIKYLNVDINVKNDYGVSLLMYLCERNYTKYIKYIKKNKLYVSNDGLSAKHIVYFAPVVTVNLGQPGIVIC